jgi:hypothetical protein
MFRSRTSMFAALYFSILLLGSLSVPAFAKPGGNSAAAAACEGVILRKEGLAD